MLAGRSFSVNRVFGKDITKQVLNSSGAAVIQNNGPVNINPNKSNSMAGIAPGK